MSLSALSDELTQVKTHKKEFLNEIERIIPWDEWVGIIKPHYYKGERGNKPYDLELMLRIHILQNLYNLADEATSCEVIVIPKENCGQPRHLYLRGTPHPKGTGQRKHL